MGYPTSKRGHAVDCYTSAEHGRMEIADPYRWLESDDSERAEWIQGKNGRSRDLRFKWN